MREILNKTMLTSRFILVVFFGGLMVALAVYALGFLKKLWTFAGNAFDGGDNQQLIALLHLLDSALVASLVVMVAVSSYDSLVSRLAKRDEEGEVGWVATVDPGNLKIKLATALIAISSIHLLQIFNYSDRDVTWALAVHGMFLAGAVVLGLLDKLTSGNKAGKM